MLGSMRSVRSSITRNQGANLELTPSLTRRLCRFGPDFSPGITAKSMRMVAMCCPVKGLTFLFAIRAKSTASETEKADHQIGFPKWFRVEIHPSHNTPLAGV